MNFLAHTLFAENDAELIVGQFCGDFVRGSQLSAFSPKVQAGIRLHRRIDRFTDQHAENRKARDLFEPPYRRFAGIMTDVVYDHFLACSWSRYASTSLEDHIDDVYAALESHFDILPIRLQRFARFVMDRDILLSYQSFSAVEAALWRISQRSDRFRLLDESAGLIRSRQAELESHFHEFFPDLVAFVQEQAVD